MEREREKKENRPRPNALGKALLPREEDTCFMTWVELACHPRMGGFTGGFGAQVTHEGHRDERSWGLAR